MKIIFNKEKNLIEFRTKEKNLSIIALLKIGMFLNQNKIDVEKIEVFKNVIRLNNLTHLTINNILEFNFDDYDIIICKRNEK